MAGIEQFRRDTSANRLGYTPLAGEFFIDTSTDIVYIGDGATVGGKQVGAFSPIANSNASYSVLDTDAGTMQVFNNAAGAAVTLAQAGSSAGLYFPDGTAIVIQNLASLGAGNIPTVVITPTTSTINGHTSLTLYPGDTALIISGGANYFAFISRENYVIPGREITFAQRPASPAVGALANFSDSTTATWGATITGTGGNHVLGRWNGTNWTVVGA